MPFVVEQESSSSEVPVKIDSDPTTVLIVTTLFLIYFLRGFIFTAIKFGLIVVFGLTLLSYLR